MKIFKKSLFLYIAFATFVATGQPLYLNGVFNNMCPDIEVFKIVEDFPAYQVSNWGRLQTRWKHQFANRSIICDEWKKMTPCKTKMGYLGCLLHDGNYLRKRINIHILVAKYFLEERQAWVQCVRHLDGDKTNNCASNLAYGTMAQNTQDRKEHGNWSAGFRNTKLTIGQILEIREKYKYIKVMELARLYNVHRCTIRRIAKERSWTKDNIKQILKERENNLITNN